MSYKSLLVAVDPTPDSDARVALATELAHEMDAYLIGACGIAQTPPPMGDPLTGGAMLGEAFTLYRDLAEAALRGALEQFHDRVGAYSDRTEWRGRLGSPADVVAQAARAADLVILGRRSSQAPSHAADPADVLMAIGRPVLIVPPGTRRIPTDGPAVVAWNDSRECQRATVAALPLLRRASRVHVLQVRQTQDAVAETEGPADVAAWLGRHGIPAEGHVAPRAAGSVTQDILAFAQAKGASLIVAGGYGHPRVREWVLGGVTEDLLAMAPMPVLLCH